MGESGHPRKKNRAMEFSHRRRKWILKRKRGKERGVGKKFRSNQQVK